MKVYYFRSVVVVESVKKWTVFLIIVFGWISSVELNGQINSVVWSKSLYGRYHNIVLTQGTILAAGVKLDSLCWDPRAVILRLDESNGMLNDSLTLGWSDCASSGSYFYNDFQTISNRACITGLLDNRTNSIQQYGLMKCTTSAWDTMGALSVPVQVFSILDTNLFVVSYSSRLVLADSNLNVLVSDTFPAGGNAVIDAGILSNSVFYCQRILDQNGQMSLQLRFYDSALILSAADTIDFYPQMDEFPVYAGAQFSGGRKVLLTRSAGYTFSDAHIFDSTGSLIMTHRFPYSRIDNVVSDPSGDALYVSCISGAGYDPVVIYKLDIAAGAVTDSVVLGNGLFQNTAMCGSQNGYLYHVSKYTINNLPAFKVEQLDMDLSWISEVILIDSSGTYTHVGDIVSSGNGEVIFNVFQLPGYASAIHKVAMSPSGMFNEIASLDIVITSIGEGAFELRYPEGLYLQQVHVYDVQGRTVLQQQQQNRFQLTAPGMYVVEVVMEDGRVWRGKLLRH